MPAAGAAAGARRTLGERFARFIIGLLEDEQARSAMTGMVRAPRSPAPRSSAS